MAQVAAVHSVAPWERSASDVLHEVRPDDVAKRRPAPHGKRVWASVEQSPREVIRVMVDEARRDPDMQRRWVVLVDGEPRQMLDVVHAEAVLRLRAVRASSDFDAHWAFHLEQDHPCNYVGRYRRRGP